MRIAVLCAVLALAGCAATPQPQIITCTVYVRQTMPPSLLTCQSPPPVPKPTSQAAVARYVVALWESGQDCRVKLAGVRSVVSAS